MNEPEYVFSHRLPLLQAATHSGFEVHLACPRISGRTAELQQRGIVAHEVSLDRGVSSLSATMGGVAQFARLLTVLKPSVVHCVTIKQVVIGGLVAKLFRVPRAVHSINGFGSVFTGSGLPGQVLQPVFLRLLRQVLSPSNVHVIVQNSDDRALLLRNRLCLEGQITVTHGSGVDLERFCPAAAAPPAPVRVVLGARMIAEKGVEEFVAAARILRTRGVAAKFVLAGAVDDKNPSGLTQDELRSWHETGDVEWLGEVRDMAQLLRESHVACLPSYREGLPKFLAEAAACGLPVVTSDAVGCRDAIVDGVTGLVVPVRDAAALADALARLISSEALRVRFGLAGRALAEQRYGQAKIAQQIVETYEPDSPAHARGAG